MHKRPFFYLLIVFLLCTCDIFAQKDDIAVTSVASMLEDAETCAAQHPERALDLCNKAYELASKQHDTKATFQALRAAAIIHEDEKQYAEALHLNEKVMLVAESLPVSDQLNTLNDISILHRKLGNYTACRQFHEKTLALAQKANDQEMIEDSYHGFGVLYSLIGDFDIAIGYYFKSLKIAETSNNILGQATTYQNIANVYLKSKNCDLALFNIQKAFQLANEASDDNRIANVLNVYGRILKTQNHLEDALAKHNQSLLIFKKLKDENNIVKTLSYIANIEAQNGQLKKAIALFRQGEPFTTNVSDYDLSQYYLDFAAICAKSNLYKDAESYLNKSLTIANKFRHTDLSQKSELALSDLYQQTNRPELAYQSLKVAHALSDTMFNVDKTKHMAEMQFKYEAEKSEKEIQGLRLRENKIWFGSLAALLLCFVIALGFISRQRGLNNIALQLKNDEIEHQNRQLEDSNEALRQFAYASAHDLKEPLRNIGSFVSLIQFRYKAILPTEAHEYMSYVTNGVKRMNDLLEGLLKYSTLIVDENESQTLETVDFYEVLSEVKENLRLTIQEKEATILCSDEIMEMPMSRLHLSQILQNLIGNSLKFVKEKKPVIRIVLKKENDTMLLTVEDNGIGIQQEYSQKVFKLFHRLSRVAQYDGTGIGLTICKKIVEKYEGKIWFDSRIDEGTRFYISLPDRLAA